VQTECNTCRATRRREHYPATKDHANARRREIYKQKAEHAAWREKQNEHHRIWRNYHRNRAGLPDIVLPTSVGKAMKMPTKPLREWITNTFPGADVADLSYKLQLPLRQIKHIMDGERKNVSIDTVDRCLLHRPERIEDIYG